MKIEDIIDSFAFFDSWEDKYRYIIELGESLPDVPTDLLVEQWKVKGCQSQVWLIPQKQADGKLSFSGTSDAAIVKGLMAIVFSLYNDKSPAEIIASDIDQIFITLGLQEHLSPSRRNGLEAMVEKIRYYAKVME